MNSRGSRMLLVVLPFLFAYDQRNASAGPTDSLSDARQPLNIDGLPDIGIDVPANVANELLEDAGNLVHSIDETRIKRDQWADIAIYPKSVRFAVAEREFSKPSEFAHAKTLLKAGWQRLQTPVELSKHRGMIVLGYQSIIDDSAQPYAVHIPPSLPLDRPVRLDVWLHGRSNKATDWAFIHQRSQKPDVVASNDAITLYVFGRFCNAYKFAGETDVFEAINAACRRFPIDQRKIVLRGFSMGGAGVWHLTAHYPFQWIAANPGAGFADTPNYLQLMQDRLPPWYEQRLWKLYDVTSCVENLLNNPVIAYSGELDKQKASADLIESLLQQRGRQLERIIGANTGHKYHPESLQQIESRLREISSGGRPDYPRVIRFETATLRYHQAAWVRVTGLSRHWQTGKVVATLQPARDRADDRILLDVEGVTSLSLLARDQVTPWKAGTEISIGNQVLRTTVDQMQIDLQFDQQNQNWIVSTVKDVPSLVKKPRLQGPIDDAWFDPFLIVLPTGPEPHHAVAKWVASENAYFVRRWRRLFRGDPRVKNDVDVTNADANRYHLVLWGTPESNSVLRRIHARLPIQWKGDRVGVAGRHFHANETVPCFVYPNPESPERYVVVNSGMTFRGHHDVTNAQQTPKLPDWAFLNISDFQTSDGAGEVQWAGFFDEAWQFDPENSGEPSREMP